MTFKIDSHFFINAFLLYYAQQKYLCFVHITPNGFNGMNMVF
jgi:hypothetical protein